MTGPGAAAWVPAARPGEPVEGLALSEWVGQALGAASMCWADVAAAGEFDSSRCGWIFDGLMAHLNAVTAGAGATGAVEAAPQGPNGSADGFVRLALGPGAAAQIRLATLVLQQALEADEPLALRETVLAALPVLRACWADLELVGVPAPGSDGQG